MSLAVCLAGGGVKGAAHIGVLKAIEEENLEYDYITGTSSGRSPNLTESVSPQSSRPRSKVSSNII